MQLNRLKERALQVGERTAEIPWRPRGIRVRSFRTWNDKLDGALAELPEQSTCDHATWRTLVAETSVEKRHCLVTSGDEVLAVVSVRRRQHYWEPVSEHCLPFAVAPARDGALDVAVRAVGLEIRCSSMRSIDGLSPTTSRYFDTYAVDLAADYEAHWRTSSIWKAVRRARAQTTELVAVPGSHEVLDWTLDNWSNRWSDDELEIANSTEDRRRAWHHLHDRGQMFIVGLTDGDRIVGGRIAVGVGDTLYDMCLGRDDEHPNRYIGTRVDDEGYRLAAQSGWKKIDLSGYHDDYKSKWGKLGDGRWSIEFLPTWRGQLSRVAAARRRLIGTLSARSTPDLSPEAEGDGAEPVGGG